MTASRAGRVAVVTDSTAALSSGQASELGVDVVPLEVIIDGQVGRDGEVSSAEVAQALSELRPVTTSRPSPASLLAAYERARHDGASAVVSIHLSAQLSGTIDGARIAAREASLDVTVVDSQQIGLALGFGVLAAAAGAAAGVDSTEVANEASRVCSAASMLFYVDTLEYLRRGGRIGAASAFLGNVLSVKPLLEVADGQIAPIEKVRTSSRALSRLLDLAVERAGSEPARLGVHHLASPDRAQTMRSLLEERLPASSPVAVRELGAVMGAHVGPGVIAVAVAPQ